MKQRFILFSMTRTGSSMVSARLSQHPDLVCYPAVFSPKGFPTLGVAPAEIPDEATGLAARLGRMDPIWRDAESRAERYQNFLDELELVSPESVMGIKHHLGMPLTERLIAERCPKIVLTRKNLLAAFSSGRLAKALGIGAAKQGDTIPNAKVPFDPEAFDTWRRRRGNRFARWREQIAATGDPVLELDYTAARTEEGVAAMCRFLGMEPAPGEWPTLKRHGSRTVDRFENPDVALAHLKAIGHEEWAEEPDSAPSALPGTA